MSNQKVGLHVLKLHFSSAQWIHIIFEKHQDIWRKKFPILVSWSISQSFDLTEDRRQSFPYTLSPVSNVTALRELNHTLCYHYAWAHSKKGISLDLKKCVLPSTQGWSYESPESLDLLKVYYSLTNQMWHLKPFTEAGFLIKATSDKKEIAKQQGQLTIKNWPYQVHS